MCKTVVIFRAMNGFSQVRIGGTGARSAAPVTGDMLHSPRLRLAERRAAVQLHLHAPHARLRHHAGAGGGGAARPTASTPPTIPRPTTRSASRWTTCWQAASSASRCTCSIAASRPTTPPPSSSPGPIGPATGRHPPRADPRHRRALLQAARRHALPDAGRSPRWPASYAREILWPNAGVGPEDVDVTGSYDAFTFTTMLQLEDYGFCKKGEGGALRQRRHHQAGRPPAQQHQRRPPVRGLHPRHEHGDRERAPARGTTSTTRARSARTASVATPTTTGKAAAVRSSAAR